MSSTDPMKEDFLIRSGITQRILHQRYLLHRKRSTRSSSLMKQTTQAMMYNFYSELSLKSLREIVDLYSPVTTKIKYSNPSIQGVLSLTFLLEERRSKKSLLISSKGSILSWSKKGLKVIRKY